MKMNVTFYLKNLNTLENSFETTEIISKNKAKSSRVERHSSRDVKVFDLRSTL